MHDGKELIRIDDPKSLVEFLQQPANKLAEFITGILASDFKDSKLSAGHLIQASIKWKLFTQLGREIKTYIEKGKIKEDYLEIDHNKQSLSDLLKFIDETSPSEDRFMAMKKLFLKSVSEDTSEEDKIISYQFMQICKQLESAHLLIIKAAFEINKGVLRNKLKSENVDRGNLHSAQEWLINISKQIGHGLSSLIEVNEDKLMNLKLISPRVHSDRSGILNGSNYRLTDLGLRLCQFMYED
ncbi:MAG: hypothetical protein RAP03_18290 [Candidatus Electryonea clarkiae]|jgi:hypothetical protein|nr:hypothetical protein [Candidatus Electryonea clarkiae]